MTLPYSPPGVTVSEVVDPTIAPLIAPPALIALVGPANGHITRRQLLTFRQVDEEEVPVPLNVPNGSIVTEVTKVEDAVYNSDKVYVEEDDYIVNISEEGSQSPTNDAATIERVPPSEDEEEENTGGTIPQGVAPDYEYSVYVTFKYIPEDYWEPYRVTNLFEVYDRFGQSLDVSGADVSINSPLSYAAEVAFENGATELICQPLFENANAPVQPTDPTEAQNWEATLTALRVAPDVNLIAPIIPSGMATSDQFAVMQKVQDHINYMRTEDQEYIIGVFGVDSVNSSITAQDIRTQARALAGRFGGQLAQQMVLISPSKFVRPYRSGGLLVGGQYMASAVAGMIAARPVYQSLTRKIVSGFVDIAEARTKAQKNQDAASGLMVIEIRNNSMEVRHALTLDTTSTAAKELSIVRAKHRVIESVKQTIDTQIIGQVIADGEAPTVVRSAVIGVLDQLRSERDIVAYGDIQSRVSSIDPTVVEIRFSYAPAFPVNYVNVVFSLDLSGGLLTAETEQG